MKRPLGLVYLQAHLLSRHDYLLFVNCRKPVRYGSIRSPAATKLHLQNALFRSLTGKPSLAAGNGSKGKRGSMQEGA